MTEGQQQGQDSGQQQEAAQAPQQQAPPQVDTNAIAAAARRDGEDSGFSKAEKELGLSVEEARQVIEAHKKRSDAEKTAEQRLTERETELSGLKDESKSHKQRADRYEKIVKANVDSQLEAMPEDIKDLLSNFDVGGQFEWLTKHGAKYVAAPEPEEGQQQQRRAPDASRRESIPGLNESNQSFNDILRQRGLSSGVS
jgi:hypothetical protein